jgi:hypothetical protein
VTLLIVERFILNLRSFFSPFSMQLSFRSLSGKHQTIQVDPHLSVKDLHDYLSKLFEIPVSTLVLVLNGVCLNENLPLTSLSVSKSEEITVSDRGIDISGVPLPPVNFESSHPSRFDTRSDSSSHMSALFELHGLFPDLPPSEASEILRRFHGRLDRAIHYLSGRLQPPRFDTGRRGLAGMRVEGEPFPTDQRNGAQRTAYTPEEETVLAELISNFDVPENVVVQIFEGCNRDAVTTRQVLNGL